LGQEGEEFSLERGDIDGREALAVIGGEALVKGDVRREESGGEEVVRGGPWFGIHGDQ
jgi:hypothetical protein